MINIYSAKEKALNETEIERLYQLIVFAYAETEVEMWGEDYIRIDRATFMKYYEQDEILVAWHENEVVGGIRHFEIDKDTYSFSLLGADFNKKGLGIGRSLVVAVEEIARKENYSKIHIEVLEPKEFKVDFKTVIMNWYERMDYEIVKRLDFAELYPENARNLLVPCDFVCFKKDLK